MSLRLEYWYFLSFSYSFNYVKRIMKLVRVWGAESVAHSCPHWTGIPTPLALGVGERYVPKT